MFNKTALQHLIGFPAKLADGKTYGSVVATYHFGAGEIIEILKPNGKMEMLPLDAKFVEVKSGYVTVTPPDYLEAKPE